MNLTFWIFFCGSAAAGMALAEATCRRLYRTVDELVVILPRAMFVGKLAPRANWSTDEIVETIPPMLWRGTVVSMALARLDAGGVVNRYRGPDGKISWSLSRNGVAALRRSASTLETGWGA